MYILYSVGRLQTLLARFAMVVRDWGQPLLHSSASFNHCPSVAKNIVSSFREWNNFQVFTYFGMNNM